MSFLFLCILQEVAKQPNNNPEGWFELKINTHVYVTGLPTDVTSEEVSNYWVLDSMNKSGCLLSTFDWTVLDLVYILLEVNCNMWYMYNDV